MKNVFYSLDKLLVKSKYKIVNIRKRKLHNISNKYLTYIPLNVFDSGLSISHLGCIYISNSAVGGKNVPISQNTTIGATNGNDNSPKIGNNCLLDQIHV